MWQLIGVTMTAVATSSFRRTLGLYPTRQGFAFAVLEARGLLVAWGFARIDNAPDTAFVARVVGLMKRYSPAVLTVEDGSTTSRGEKVKRRTARAVEIATSRSCDVRPISRAMVRRALGLSADATSHDMAMRTAELFGELVQHLPPKRRLWESEDRRMPLFHAVGLALSAT
jgi:hypothetical protein